MFSLREVKLVMAGLGVGAAAFDFPTCTDLHSSAHSVIHYDFTEGYTSGAAVPQDKVRFCLNLFNSLFFDVIPLNTI